MRRYGYVTAALGVVLVLATGSVWGQRVHVRTAEPRHGDLEQLPDSAPRTNDAVLLDNDDRLSGTILRLEGEMLVVEPELIEGEVRIPFKNVKVALCRTPEESPALPGDRLIFPNGDRLRVTAHGLEEGVLQATTCTGEQIAVKTDALTGIIFERKAFTVYENDFESGELKGLTPLNGEWAIENGKLVQKRRNASFSNVALEVSQDGRFTYQWTADLMRGHAYGFYFFAENKESAHGRNAYFVLAQNQSIHLYKVRNNNQQYYANYTLRDRKQRTAFRLDYDPANGHIILNIDGKNAFRYRDPKPIQNGRYVLLRVDSVGSFDDLTIERLGGGPILATDAKARERDIVSLLNKDEVSGTIVSMDDETVRMETDYDEVSVDIQRSLISSLTFSRLASRPAPADSVRLTLMEGDVVTGRLISLDEEKVVVETDVVGTITLARTRLRECRMGEAGGGAFGGPDVEPAHVLKVEMVRD